MHTKQENKKNLLDVKREQVTSRTISFNIQIEMYVLSTNNNYIHNHYHNNETNIGTKRLQSCQNSEGNVFVFFSLPSTKT